MLLNLCVCVCVCVCVCKRESEWVSSSTCVAGSGYSPTVEGRRSVLAH